MVGLAELARACEHLDERAVDHLQGLVAAWAPLADLSFADLLLYSPCDAQHARALGVLEEEPERHADRASTASAATAHKAPSTAAGADAGSTADEAASADAGHHGRDFIVLAHIRSNTGPTIHAVDPVGTLAPASARPWLGRAIDEGAGGESEIVELGVGAAVTDDSVVEEQTGMHLLAHHRAAVIEDSVVEERASMPLGEHVRVVEYVPVRCDGAPVAVLARESAPASIRHDNPLETVYRGLYARFAAMIAQGAFPYERMERVGEFREPRVGDGVIVLDREGHIEYASPNARSALHRLGVTQSVHGFRLSELGLDDTVIRRSFWRRCSTVDEYHAAASSPVPAAGVRSSPVPAAAQAGAPSRVADGAPRPDTDWQRHAAMSADMVPSVTVVLRSYPMVADDRITGALAFTRDVSELRHHDRLLLSKDATIREIHHRVKNNLQTVSSLLQLQSRRLASKEAKAAVQSSVQRVSAIAMVHEQLSIDITSELDFDGVVKPLLAMVSKGLAASEHAPKVEVSGTLGYIDGDVAMPLAVVLVELVQNALQHAVTPNEAGEFVNIAFSRGRGRLKMRVEDDGPGVAAGFSLDRDAGLGLTIVRTFVVHDLEGAITIRSASDHAPRGTVVEVTVPGRRPAAANV